MTTITKHRWIDSQEDVSGAFKTASGESFPRNWLDLATADDLARVGIEAYEYTPPPKPEPTTDQLFPPLAKYQFDAMVDFLGLEAAITDYINTMPAGIERSLARSLFRNGVDGEYRRSSPLFSQIAGSASVPITSDEIDAFWPTARAL